LVGRSVEIPHVGHHLVFPRAVASCCVPNEWQVT
jgi:hypothetical protein